MADGADPHRRLLLSFFTAYPGKRLLSPQNWPASYRRRRSTFQSSCLIISLDFWNSISVKTKKKKNQPAFVNCDVENLEIREVCLEWSFNLFHLFRALEGVFASFRRKCLHWCRRSGLLKRRGAQCKCFDDAQRCESEDKNNPTKPPEKREECKPGGLAAGRWTSVHICSLHSPLSSQPSQSLPPPSASFR